MEESSVRGCEVGPGFVVGGWWGMFFLREARANKVAVMVRTAPSSMGAPGK